MSTVSTQAQLSPAPVPSHRDPFALGASCLLLAMAYCATGLLGLESPYIGHHITLLWIPTGIAVAALMRSEFKLWPGVALGAFAVNLAVGSSPFLAAAIAVGNTLAPLASVAWLRRKGFHATLDRLRDVLLLCLSAVLGMLVSATGGVVSLYLAGVLAAPDTLSAWLIWWMGDMLGVVLAAPLLLAFPRDWLLQLVRHSVEFLAWLLLNAGLAWFIFIHDQGSLHRSLPLAYLTVALLVWPAMRFGVVGASLTAMFLSALAAVGSAMGRGVFQVGDVQLGLFLLWAYMATASITGLMVAGLMAENNEARAALRRERDEKQRYLSVAGSVIVVLDRHGRVSQINPAGCRLLGCPESDILGTDWVVRYFPEENQAYILHMQQRFLSGEEKGELRDVQPIIRPGDDHEVRLVSWCASALHDDDGNVSGILCSGEDISERRRYEVSLEAGRAQLRAILDAATESILMLDLDGRVISCNNAGAWRFGLTSAEIVGKCLFDLLHADRVPLHRRLIQEVIERGTRRYGEDEWDDRYFAHHYYPVFDVAQHVTGIVTFSLDISDAKRAERRNNELLQRYELLMATATDGIHIVDRHGAVVEVNDSFCTMLGYSREELATMRVADWDANFTAEALEDVFERCFASPTVLTFDTVQRRKDGCLIDAEIYARAVTLDGVDYIYTSSRDVTERKKAQRESAESERRYRLTVEAINEGLFDWDVASGVIHCDARWYALLGYPPDAFANSRDEFVRHVHPDDLDIVIRDEHRMMTTHDTIVHEVRVRASDGSWRWLQGRASAVEWNADGSTRRILGAHTDISARKQAEIELQQSKDRLHMLLTSMLDRVLLIDAAGVVTEAFTAAGGRGPYLPAELTVGCRYREVLPAEVADAFGEAMAGLMQDGVPRTFEFSLQSASGEKYVSMATLSPLMAVAGDAQGCLAVIRDITAMHRSQREVERLAHRNALLLESLGEGVCGVDQGGRVTFINRAALNMLGLTTSEVVGNDPHALFHHHHQDGSEYPEAECPINQTLQDGLARHLESEWYWHRDGHGFPVSMTVTPIMEQGESVGAVVVFQNIAERKKTEEEIHKLAFFDPLTRLPNRRLLADRISQALLASERTGERGAVVFIDLDNFKSLNDTVGHEAGDLLLCQVAQRLLECVRSQDTVARLGGDEFVVLLGGLDPSPLAVSQIMAVAEKIRASLAQPYLLAGIEHHSTPSIGIAPFSGSDLGVDELLRRADAAMYKAKAAGRNVVRLWQDVSQLPAG